MPINFRIVLPNQLYRSGQIAPSEMNGLIREPYNINKFVSLDKNAGDLISRYIPQGIEHVMFPLLEGNGSIEARSLANAIKGGLLNSNKAVLVHCKNGQDRTGLAIAMYRTIKQGWSCTQAIQEAKSLGYGTGLNNNILNQYNIEICRTCQVSHPHYCQSINSKDISHVDDIVNQMRDDFSHQAGWPSAGVIPPGASTEYSFAPYISPNSEGALGAKAASSRARKKILKKVLKYMKEKNKLEQELNFKHNEDNNSINLPISGQIDNYSGSPANAPSATPGSPNSAGFSADPVGMVQL